MVEVSVIMTFFNENVDQIKRSVSSILNQTFKNLEFIVVAGNPDNKDSINYLKGLSDPRLILDICPKKERMTNCLNKAIRMCKGKYIAIQEADDESLPERLEEQYLFMTKNPEIDVVGASIRYIDDYSKEILAVRKYPADPTYAFHRYAAIAHPTIFVKRHIFETKGYYAESDEFRNCPDYELWFRWLIGGVKFYNLNKVLFNYYQTKDNGRNKNAKKTLKAVVKLKEENKKHFPFSIKDNLFLIAEKVLSFFPQSFISRLFYVWVKLS